jgi:hypothetical protein
MFQFSPEASPLLQLLADAKHGLDFNPALSLARSLSTPLKSPASLGLLACQKY